MQRVCQFVSRPISRVRGMANWESSAVVGEIPQMKPAGALGPRPVPFAIGGDYQAAAATGRSGFAAISFGSATGTACAANAFLSRASMAHAQIHEPSHADASVSQIAM